MESMFGQNGCSIALNRSHSRLGRNTSDVTRSIENIVRRRETRDYWISFLRQGSC